MPHPRLVIASTAAALLGFALTACAPESTEGGGPAPSPSPSIIASPPATPADRVVEIPVDGLSIDDGPVLAYDDADGALAALTDAFGAAPTEAPVKSPYGAVYAGYDWPGTKATVRDTRIDLVVSADAPGVIVRAPEGIGIGSTRAEAMAVDGWDEDGDGVADYLSIGVREVPGTSSLVNPGEVGVEYVDLTMTGDIVSRLSTGGNDFSDI